MLRDAIDSGLEHRDEAMAYAAGFGRGIDAATADEFVAMYVNELTLDMGERGRRAVAELLAPRRALAASPSSSSSRRGDQRSGTVLLGLRLGRHVDGVVDAYFGPSGAGRAGRGRAAGTRSWTWSRRPTHSSPRPRTAGWVTSSRGLRAYAGVLAGEAISYADEVERCYGVRPARVADETSTRRRTSSSTRLLPGDGSLFERRAAWKRRHAVPVERLVPALRDVVADLRDPRRRDVRPTRR